MNTRTRPQSPRYSKALRWSLALMLSLLVLSAGASAEVCNVKVLTDATPDYSDIGSMIHSITSNWKSDEEKCFALFYWNHIARRQTSPQDLHGLELTDPIRQFNDYGYTMCSTVSGVNCGTWGAMGYGIKFWDISMHTVCEVEYGGAGHMYDSSLSAIYTRCDGKTVAGVEEIGAEGACDASAGKKEPGHIARYHCLFGTGPKGFLTGADTMRSLDEEYACFNPNGLKFRWYYNNWDLGHRFGLDLRDNEVYTRLYHRGDTDSPNKVRQGDEKSDYFADPAYYVPNHGFDPETPNVRYLIRGNGLRTYQPALTKDALAKEAFSMTGMQAFDNILQPADPAQTGEVVFKVEGANVITSMTIKAAISRKGDKDAAAIAVSTDNGRNWQSVWAADKTGDLSPQVKLIKEVNGSYDVLVKVALTAGAAAADAQLKSISFDTITQVNSKTLPRLKIGKNAVYVGAGEQTNSVSLWPELQGDKYKPLAVEEKNMASAKAHPGYQGTLFAANAKEDAYVVFRLDAPQPMTAVTFGGRYYVRTANARVETHYSFDEGKTWTKMYSLTDNTPPWDVIHYDTVKAPENARSVLVKYLLNGDSAGCDACSIYSVRMEAFYKPAEAAFKPLEVTFTWKERQEDYSLLQRSHTQLVEKSPFTYDISVGGADHPVMESMQVNVKGASPATQPAKYGYSDGKDLKAEKFKERWVTVGKILSTGKPYTASIPSATDWESGDPDGTKLTDGIVGPPYTGGTAYRSGGMWHKDVEITVDLGKAEKCGAFRIHTGGYPWWDGLKGEVADKVEVLTSKDGKDFTSQGNFDFRMRWKHLPANHMWPDDEQLCGHNYEMIVEKPVEAQFVKFKVSPKRALNISEVQVLDGIKYESFDLKLAFPDGKDRSDMSQFNPKHVERKAK